MEILSAIFFALVALFILVTVHEFGHFWVARRCGVKVLRFSIGFGKPFARFTWQGTEFALAPIPLGGYVKMFGESAEEPIDARDHHLSFSHKSVWQRMAIVAAGPVANFLLAILFYWMVFMGGLVGYAPLIQQVEPESPAAIAGMPVGQLDSPLEIIRVDGAAVQSWRDVFDRFVRRIGESGEMELVVRPYGFASGHDTFLVPLDRWQGNTDSPDFLGSLGLAPYTPPLEPLVGELVVGGVAAQAGLEVGDRVLAADNENMDSWQRLRDYIAERPGVPVRLQIDRSGERLALELVPDGQMVDGREVGRIGIMAAAPLWPDEMKRPVSFNIPGAFTAGVEQMASTSRLILDSLRKLVTGQISTKSLGGPISIAKYANTSAEAGWQSFFMFVAALSVMLAVVNLLPIPVLDGGHLLFYAIEAVKGSPVSDWIQGLATRFGVAVLLGVMILALYNDFTRL
jgi:regulator of sigma E protease